VHCPFRNSGLHQRKQLELERRCHRAGGPFAMDTAPFAEGFFVGDYDGRQTSAPTASGHSSSWRSRRPLGARPTRSRIRCVRPAAVSSSRRWATGRRGQETPGRLVVRSLSDHRKGRIDSKFDDGVNHSLGTRTKEGSIFQARRRARPSNTPAMSSRCRIRRWQRGAGGSQPCQGSTRVAQEKLDLTLDRASHVGDEPDASVFDPQKRPVEHPFRCSRCGPS
jgi:hypothetical protein